MLRASALTLTALCYLAANLAAEPPRGTYEWLEWKKNERALHGAPPSQMPVVPLPTKPKQKTEPPQPQPLQHHEPLDQARLQAKQYEQDFSRYERYLAAGLQRAAFTNPGGEAAQFLAGQAAAESFQRSHGLAPSPSPLGPLTTVSPFTPEVGPPSPREEQLEAQRQFVVRQARQAAAAAGQAYIGLNNTALNRAGFFAGSDYPASPPPESPKTLHYSTPDDPWRENRDAENRARAAAQASFEQFKADGERTRAEYRANVREQRTADEARAYADWPNRSTNRSVNSNSYAPASTANNFGHSIGSYSGSSTSYYDKYGGSAGSSSTTGNGSGSSTSYYNKYGGSAGSSMSMLNGNGNSGTSYYNKYGGSAGSSNTTMSNASTGSSTSYYDKYGSSAGSSRTMPNGSTGYSTSYYDKYGGSAGSSRTTSNGSSGSSTSYIDKYGRSTGSSTVTPK